MTLELKHEVPEQDLQLVGHVVAQLERGERTVTLPESLTSFISDVLRHVQQGDALTVFTAPQELTTSEAAKLLGVSRPFLVGNLLDAGLIPFHYVGSHRRIYATDLMNYQHEQQRREDLMAEITREAQDMDLY